MQQPNNNDNDNDISLSSYRSNFTFIAIKDDRVEPDFN
jgi:hypothetical protein